MDNGIGEPNILNFFSQYIIGNKIIFTAIVGLFTWFIKIKYEENMKKKNPEIVLKMEYHTIFRTLEKELLKVETFFDVGNEGKNIIYKDIIRNFFRIIREELSSLVKDTQVCSHKCPKINGHYCNKTFLRNEEGVYNILKKLSNFYKINNNYTEEEKGVMDIIMRKFLMEHSDLLDNLIMEIKEITTDKYINMNCNVTQAILFNLYIQHITEFTKVINEILKKLNGDLDSLNFRGFPLS